MDVLVTVQCITFNHRKYLAQALDSFLMQRTTFGYEVIVHDDCSTDGTTDILRDYASKYPDIIKPIYEDENQWKKTGMKPVFARMTEMSRGKYIAYCEGDDFWQDPYKLQKQVDAMERCDDATICYTAFQVTDNAGTPIPHEQYKKKNRMSKSGEIFFDLLKQNFILTPTTLYRKEVFTSPIYLNTPLRLDYFVFLSAAAIGKTIYLPEKTACYRQSPNGAMATQLTWVRERFSKIREYFLLAYATGKIKKPWSWQSIAAKIEAWNIAIRKYQSGDCSWINQLKGCGASFPMYYALAWIQIKIQNIKYKNL
jgi:glycosyltransferase involved in cell wall biosynthesis